VLSTFFSVKGGVGVSTVTALVALAHAGRATTTTIVDTCGDQPALLGIAEPDGPGIREWAATPGRPDDALDRISIQATPDLAVIPAGAAAWPHAGSAGELASALQRRPEQVFIDAGLTGRDPYLNELLRHSSERLLVLRCCSLTLRAIGTLDPEPTGVVLIRERGRALGPGDVENVSGAPVVAEVSLDIAVARCIDAGLVTSRVPRALLRSLSGIASAGVSQ